MPLAVLSRWPFAFSATLGPTVDLVYCDTRRFPAFDIGLTLLLGGHGT